MEELKKKILKEDSCMVVFQMGAKKQTTGLDKVLPEYLS
jgi:hypothetical protein